MYLYITSGVWLIGTILVFYNDRRALGISSLIIGGGLVYSLFTGKIGMIGVSFLAMWDVVLVMVNKYDMRH